MASEAADIGDASALTSGAAAIDRASVFCAGCEASARRSSGLIIIALLALVAIFGPALAPYHPDADDFGMLQPPSLAAPDGHRFVRPRPASAA